MLDSTIDDLLRRDGQVTTASLARRLKISRQAAHRRLAREVETGTLVAVGQARARHYIAAAPTLHLPIAGTAEDDVLRRLEDRLAEKLGELQAATRDTFGYALTEMVNNALDHSGGELLTVRADIADRVLRLSIDDDGVGAFESVRRARKLNDHIEAAAEITKGKVTTMPERHTGEGLFFTSRAATRFSLTANGTQLVVDNVKADIAIREVEHANGTRVELQIADPPQRTLQEVFAAHTDEFEFSKTRTIVKLFGLGRDFVSRSEARRLLHGLEQFREIVVDFEGVESIGQGFADEVFRVFALRHPGIRLIPVQMVTAVQFFVERAERARG